MSIQKSSKTVTLTFNQLHQPIMQPPGDGKLYLQVCEGDGENVMRHVRIAGGSDALQELGEFLLGISEANGHHTHFDEEVDGNWFECKQGFSLTIENLDKPERKEGRQTVQRPPDWARG